MSIWDDLAQRIRDVARYHVHQESPPPMYFKVVATRPLSMDQIDGPLALHENDPDVELMDNVELSHTKVGDTAIVQQAGPADNPGFVVMGVMQK